MTHAGMTDQPVPVPGYLGRLLDSEGIPVGTCFQIVPDVLVTACHVLDEIGAATVGAEVSVDPLAGGDPTSAVVLRLDPIHDLAALRGGGLLAMSGKMVATDELSLRTEVSATGHAVLDDPGVTYRFLTAPGEWAGATLRDGVVPLGRMTSNDVVKGMSGAPVIRSDGAVVGVMSGRFNSADGWLAGTAWIARTEDLAFLLHGLADVSLSSGPFDLPPLRPGVVRRASLLAQAREAFREPGPVLGLIGPSGSGKSTFARQFAGELLSGGDIDQVLWLNFGGEGDPREVVASVHARLTGIPPSLGRLSEMTHQLVQELPNPRPLVVIDEAADDQLDEVLGSLGGLPTIAVGRSSAWLARWRARRIDIGDLETSEAVEIFRSDSAYSLDEAEAALVIDKIGRWPLLVALASAFARGRLMRGVAASDVVQEMLRRYQERGVTAFDPRSVPKKAAHLARERAIRTSIQAMLETLEPADRDRYSRLATLPPNEWAPVSVVQDLWSADRVAADEAEDILDDFDSSSLLLYDRPNRLVQVHLLLRAYLERLDLSVPTWHAELISVWGDKFELADPYRVRWYSYHAEKAGLTDELRDLVSVAWRDHSAKVTNGPYAFSEDLFRAADSFSGAGAEVSGDELKTRFIRAALMEDARKIPLAALAALARAGDFDRAVGYLSLLPADARDVGLAMIGARVCDRDASIIARAAGSMTSETSKAVFAAQVCAVAELVSQADPDAAKEIALAAVGVFEKIRSADVESHFIEDWDSHLQSSAQRLVTFMPTVALGLLDLMESLSSRAFGRADLAERLISQDMDQAKEILAATDYTWKKDEALSYLTTLDPVRDVDGALSAVRQLSHEQAIIDGLCRIARSLAPGSPLRTSLIAELADVGKRSSDFYRGLSLRKAASLMLPDIGAAESLISRIEHDSTRAEAMAEVAVSVDDHGERMRLAEAAVDIIERDPMNYNSSRVGRLVMTVDIEFGVRVVRAANRSRGPDNDILLKTVINELGENDCERAVQLILEKSPSLSKRLILTVMLAGHLLPRNSSQAIAVVEALPEAHHAAALTSLALVASMFDPGLTRELTAHALTAAEVVETKEERAAIYAAVANILLEFDDERAREMIGKSMATSRSRMSPEELTYLVAASRLLGRDDPAVAAAAIRRAEPSWLKVLGLVRLAVAVARTDVPSARELLGEAEALVDGLLDGQNADGADDDLLRTAYQVVLNSMSLYDGQATRDFAEAIREWCSADVDAQQPLGQSITDDLQRIGDKIGSVEPARFTENNESTYLRTDIIREIALALVDSDMAPAIAVANRLKDPQEIVDLHIDMVSGLLKLDKEAGHSRAMKIAEKLARWNNPKLRVDAMARMGLLFASDAEVGRNFFLALAMMDVTRLSGNEAAAALGSIIPLIAVFRDEPFLHGAKQWAEAAIASGEPSPENIWARMSLAEAFAEVDPGYARTLAEEAFRLVPEAENAQADDGDGDPFPAFGPDPSNTSLQRVLVGMSRISGARALSLASQTDAELSDARTELVLGEMSTAAPRVRIAASAEVAQLLRDRGATLSMTYLAAFVMGLSANGSGLTTVGNALLKALNWRESL